MCLAYGVLKVNILVSFGTRKPVKEGHPWDKPNCPYFRVVLTSDNSGYELLLEK
jgi:hypothetical protein